MTFACFKHAEVGIGVFCLRALEFIQNIAAGKPSLGEALVVDSLGELHVPLSSLRKRLLEAFRLRSEHAASIDANARQAIALRLVEEYGSAQAASDAVWALARENEWYREGEGAERYLLRQATSLPIRNAAALDLTVAWHGSAIGQLSHDGFDLTLNGKDERLHRADFRKLAGTLGLRGGEADGLIDAMLERLSTATATISMPRISGLDSTGDGPVARMLELCRARVRTF